MDLQYSLEVWTPHINAILFERMLGSSMIVLNIKAPGLQYLLWMKYQWGFL